MSEERLEEIRDILLKQLEQTRAMARRQEETAQQYKDALASHRKIQQSGVVMIVVLLGLLAWYLLK